MTAILVPFSGSDSPVWALSVQVGERAADKIVFSVAELTGNIWMMENISE